MAKKVKPVLKVDKNKFINTMCDENGVDMSDVAKFLKKKGSFTLEDLVSITGYISSNQIKDKKSVPKELRDSEDEEGFEVYPTNFQVVFVN